MFPKIHTTKAIGNKTAITPKLFIRDGITIIQTTIIAITPKILAIISFIFFLISIPFSFFL